MPNDPYRLLTVAACRDHFYTKLRGVPVHRAAEILDKLGASNELFWWVWRDANKKRWSPAVLAKSGLASWPAKSIDKIKFLGGPPHKRQLFHGTFFTLLIDRILKKVDTDGLEGLRGIVEIDEVYA